MSLHAEKEEDVKKRGHVLEFTANVIVRVDSDTPTSRKTLKVLTLGLFTTTLNVFILMCC